MSRVRLQGVEKRYGDHLAVASLDLDIREGEFLTLLGPSGCGKTTTLRMIAGFVRPTAGRLFIDEDDVTAVPPQRRGIGMVFQDYALFPHMTIAENIGFGLVERGAAKDRVAARVRELLELIRLPDIGERYPTEISGGQQQRIALARAVAHPPRVLLMDEPLGALDLKLRETMQLELRRIQQALRITTVYVTHDQSEAMTMSDRIAVMNAGSVEQLGIPTAIYDTPRTRFVADFVGKINFIPGAVAAAGASALIVTPLGRFEAVNPDRLQSGQTATIAVRPENISFLSPEARATTVNRVDGTVEGRSFVGNLLHVTLRVDATTTLIVETRPQDPVPPDGARATIGWRPERAILLPER